VCDNLQLRTDKLDEVVWNEVRALLEDPGRLEQEFQRRLMAVAGQDESIATRAQVDRIRQGIARLIDTYAEGYIQQQEFEPRISRLRQRLAELEEQAQRARDDAARQAELQLVITRLEDFADQVRGGLQDADWNTRRELIRALVKRIEIGKDEVNVVFRVTPSPFDTGPERGGLPHCWRRRFPTARKHLPAPARPELPEPR